MARRSPDATPILVATPPHAGSAFRAQRTQRLLE
jgi:hypothetical protein